MALFKILKGNSTALNNQPLVDGYAYFTPDDGRFYIDAALTTAPGYYIKTGVVNGQNIYRIEVESGTWAELNNTKKTIQTAVNDPAASGTAIDFIATISQNANGDITATKSTVRNATSSAAGVTKLFSDTAQSVAANAVSATANRTYGIQANSSGQMVVNVPWTDTLNTAGSTDTATKIYLVGATTQTASAQTYSNSEIYATNGQLDANKIRIDEAVTLQYNTTTKSLDFIFA